MAFKTLPLELTVMSPFLEVSAPGMGAQALPGNQVLSKEWDLTPGTLVRAPSLLLPERKQKGKVTSLRSHSMLGSE